MWLPFWLKSDLKLGIAFEILVTIISFTVAPPSGQMFATIFSPAVYPVQSKEKLTEDDYDMTEGDIPLSTFLCCKLCRTAGVSTHVSG